MRKLLLTISLLALLGCGSKEKDCDAAFKALLIPLGSTPEVSNEATRDVNLARLDKALGSWSGLRKQINTDDVKSGAQAWADTMKKRRELLAGLKPAPSKPKAPLDETSAKELSRKELLDAVAKGAVDDIIGDGVFSDADHEALRMNDESIDKARVALADICQ